MIRYVLAAAVVLTAVGGAPSARAEFISTLPSWGGHGVYPFGEADYATMGQTITVGSDNVLENFSFRLRYLASVSNGPDSVDFAAYVMQWDGTKATGPVLFSSGPMNLATSQLANQTFTINTGSLALTTGNQYVLFFSASNFFDGELGSGIMGITLNDNAYTGGTAVLSDNLSNFANLTTNSWEAIGFGDLAFTANLTSVPAPPGAVLFGLGLASVGGVRVFRRKPAAA